MLVKLQLFFDNIFCCYTEDQTSITKGKLQLLSSFKQPILYISFKILNRNKNEASSKPKNIPYHEDPFNVW